MDQITQSNFGINVSGTMINNLRFADDIDRFNDNHNSLQEHIEQLTKMAEEVGLIVNTKKTKTIVFADKKY